MLSRLGESLEVFRKALTDDVNNQPESEGSYIPHRTPDRAIDWDEFKGNISAVERLKLEVENANISGNKFPNTLFYGNAGCGKTTLARIVANATGAKIYEMTGSSISTPMDLFKFFYDVYCKYILDEMPVIVFIDEIHGIIKGKLNDDIWLPILEEGKFYHGLHGKEYTHIAKYPVLDASGSWIEPGQQINTTITSNVQTFEYITFIGATTDPGLLSDALRRRFPLTISLRPYSKDDIQNIIAEYVDKNNVNADQESIEIMANRSRMTPAFAIHHILRQAISCSRVRENKPYPTIIKDDVLKACSLIGVGEEGVTQDDVTVLKALKSVHPKGLGIKNLASTANMSINLVENMVLPFLQHKGWVVTTHRRFITEDGIKKLGVI